MMPEAEGAGRLFAAPRRRSAILGRLVAVGRNSDPLRRRVRLESLYPDGGIAAATAISPAAISGARASATAAPVSMPSVVTICGAPGSPHRTARPAVLSS